MDWFNKYFKEDTRIWPRGKYSFTKTIQGCWSTYSLWQDLTNRATSCELFPHTSCFTDLALSDYFLFQNVRKWISYRRFGSNDGTIFKQKCLFWKMGGLLLFARSRKIGETLDDVYGVQMFLDWEIKRPLSNRQWFI